MFSGPPVYLMWSSMYNPERQKLKGRADLRRIARLFRPYWWMECQVIAAIFINSLLGLAPPLLTLAIIDKALAHHDQSALTTYVVLMVVSAIGSGLIGVYQGYLNALVGESIIRDLNCALVSHLHRMPLSFFTATKTGEIMNRVSSDVESVDAVVTGTLVSIVTNVITVATTLVTIFLLDLRLALVSVAVVPLMVLPLWPVGRRMYEARKKTRTKKDELQAATQETLSVSGIQLVKSFGRERYEHERFYKITSDLMKLEVNVALVGRWFMMAITAMVVIGPGVIWLWGGLAAIKGDITTGVLVSFVGLLARLYTPVSALAGVQVQIISALAVFERIFDYLDMQEERDSEGAIAIAGIQGRIAFNNVTLQYDETGERKALDDISFVIEPGQVVAFVGPSGAGKSSLINLLPRLYDPSSGDITIDGIDIKHMTRDSLHQHIGIVSQETYLFHDTIAHNLLYARPDATLQEITEACQKANIHEAIQAMPDGYDTIVGERGHKLSGGERQRIAIARVLLKDPEILVLDEATSALDTENEAIIQKALTPLMRGRTCLVVAHRLSTIVNADLINVIAGGRLVESGNHQSLMAQNGLYARLYSTSLQS